ncbi:hypothetical protein F511_20760 [Dorcoceras hygrometricum]|uniref:Uncharacterized protein n=1 Tax=Dorcoceras hygrometricum TaxID=472368 RepID=A0A2Z7A6W0_9LAMI|nr:hypothetical protein F511_20760 [Dorcoceras hygrometricum]
MGGEGKLDDQIKAVWFAAGTAALMACIGRATVVSLFAHWRVWAFLALNLLLLAILFTSKSHDPYPSRTSTDTQDGNADRELEKKKTMQLSQPDVRADVVAHRQYVQNKTESKREGDGKFQEEARFELSKEELNQRAENFIAMFRQHLVTESKSPFVHRNRH